MSSAQVVLEVICAGHRCGAAGRWTATTRNAALDSSREAGWAAVLVDGAWAEMCVECAADFRPALKCPEAVACGYEIADLIGHDREGHRMVRLMARRHGVRTVGQLLDWEERGWLVDLGKETRKRVLEVLKS